MASLSAQRWVPGLLALLCLTTAAAALEPGQKPRDDQRKTEARKPSPSLDDLYGRLKDSEDDAEAKGASRLIEQRLGRSGSATADLLTERARLAMSSQDVPLAVELMDRATTLEPGWAEGWNRRATLFWQLSDPASAIADLKRALVIEPRHFEAWAALGRIYLAGEDKRRALDAFRRAAAIYPRMDKLQSAIDRLAPDVDGRDL